MTMTKSNFGRKEFNLSYIFYHSPQLREGRSSRQELGGRVHREAAEDTASWHVLPRQLSMLSYGTQDFLSAVTEPFHINRPSRKCPTDVPTRQPGGGMRAFNWDLPSQMTRFCQIVPENKCKQNPKGKLNLVME